MESSGASRMGTRSIAGATCMIALELVSTCQTRRGGAKWVDTPWQVRAWRLETTAAYEAGVVGVRLGRSDANRVVRPRDHERLVGARLGLLGRLEEQVHQESVAAEEQAHEEAENAGHAAEQAHAIVGALLATGQHLLLDVLRVDLRAQVGRTGCWARALRLGDGRVWGVEADLILDSVVHLCEPARSARGIGSGQGQLARRRRAVTMGEVQSKVTRPKAGGGESAGHARAAAAAAL